MLKRIVAVTALLMVSGLGKTALANESLYPMFENRGAVKVFVEPASDTSPVKKANLADLKTQLEKHLSERKSIVFEIVPDAKQAHITIGCEVFEFYYTEHDPVDHLTGMAMIAWDAANQEKYARLQTKMIVKDAATGKELWKRVLKATVTEKEMTEEQGILEVNKHLAQVFLKEAFSKARSSSNRSKSPRR